VTEFLSPVWLLFIADLRGALRRRWLATVVLAGLVAVTATVFVAATRDGQTASDGFHAGAITTLLGAGLVAALGLGASALNRDSDSRFLGLAHVAGAPRGSIALARVLSRLAALGGAIFTWWAGFQVGAAAIGLGLDGPLAVHALATFESLSLVLIICAASSTILGPGNAAFLGIVGYVIAQSVVNLKAATDTGLIASSWNGVTRVLYAVFPRIVQSPLLGDLGNRGEGGPFAARFEINKAAIPIFSASWTTVLWTLAWCVILTGLAVRGMRNRAL
jgi:hypothetical protein